MVAIAGGGDFCLALKSDGSVVAWGRHEAGQTNVPTGLTNVAAISAGDGSAFALVHGQRPVLTAPTINLRFDSGGFKCDIETQSGRVYRLEFKETLADEQRTPLPLVAGNGKLRTLRDPAGQGGTRFYRVRRW